MKQRATEPEGFAVHPILLVAWFALGAAFLELGYLGGLKLYRQVIFASPHILWMTPLAYLLLFAPLVPILLLSRRVMPAAHQGRFSLYLLAAAVAFSVLTLFWIPLGPLSAIVLAAGIAVQLRRAVRRQAGFARLVRGTLPWMVGLVLLAAAGIAARDWYRARADARGNTARPGAPNVILLVLDTVRGMSMSLYGYARQTTPALERFASRAAVFQEAYSAAPWTLPSIATMFTGRYPEEHSADWTTPLPGRDRTLAEAFRDAGYRTAGFVANLNYASAEVGLDRGFMHYEDYTTSLTDVFLSAAPSVFVLNNPRFRNAIRSYDTFGRKNADDVNAAFLAWLDRDQHRPFFAFLNYYDAHEPYLPPSPFDTLFGPDTLRNKAMIRHKSTRDANRIRKPAMTAEERAAEQQAYDGAIAYLDSGLGRLFAELDRKGLTDNTIVVITSDHGELFGEHSLFDHGNSLYLPLLRVPLLLRVPNLAGGSRIATPVTLRDLPRTILDLAGLSDPTIPGGSFATLAQGTGVPADGSPLAATLSPAPHGPPSDPASKGRMWSIISSSHALIVGGDGTEELFDLVRDPAQLVNLANEPAARPILDRLRVLLDSVRRN